MIWENSSRDFGLTEGYRMRNGYIKKLGPDKYQLTVTLGSGRDGKRNRYYKTIQAKNDSEAEKQMAVFYEDCRQDRIPVGSKMKFSELVELWKVNYGEVYLKKSTLVTHMRNLKMNFGVFMDKKLSAIKVVDINKWITYLYKERNLSPKTIRNNFSLLQSILQKGVVWEYIDKNPARNIELPRQRRKEAQFYNAEELRNLLTILEAVPIEQQNYKVGILLALFGGLRRGEICGLDKDDVNLEKGTISIRQTRMVYGEGGLYIDTPKTEQSMRTITLPSSVMEEIEKLYRYQTQQEEDLQEVWQNSSALLKNEIGAPLYPQSLLRWFYRLQNENNLKHLSLHGLRHTHTSMLRDCGMTLEETSRRLGHSQKSTTLNIYDHILSFNDDEAARRLENRYLNSDR